MIRCEKSEETILIDNGLLRLLFHVAPQSVVLRELSGPGTGNVLADLGGIGDLWRVGLLGPDGTSPVYPTMWGKFEGAGFSQHGTTSEVTLSWSLRLSRHGEGKVIMRVALEEASALSRWRLRVELPAGWRLVKVDFPLIHGIRVDAFDRLATSTGWGAEYDLTRGVNYPGQYPSWEAGMQMVAFYGKERGLYCAAHDPNACLKNLAVEASAGTARFTLLNFPIVTEGAWELPFDAVVGLYDGDWVEASRIYRDFTRTTPWGRMPVVSKRGIPQWMQDTDLWLRPDGAPEANIQITKKALDYFGGNTALHWYRWHEIEYDVDYPEYFPPLPGFADAVAEFHRAGSHVVPYINARIWDPDSKSWKEKNAARSAARQLDGTCYSEIYGSRIPNNVMCPSTELWQSEITAIVERLLNECGTAGVYVDQVCAARGVPCYSSDHGHAPGGGDNWFRGYREMLRRIRERMPPGTVLTTEECAEPFLDFFDAHIIVNTPMELKSIPLFAAVYSDRTIGYCFLYFTKDEPENWLTFRAKNARAFLYGAQVGWIQPARILDPAVTLEAEFLRDLANTRSHARPFVTDGEFVRLLDVAGHNEVLRGKGSGGFGPDYQAAETAVTASAWKTGSRFAILVCNISNEDRQVEVMLPKEFPRARRASISGPAGIAGEAVVARGAVAVTILKRQALVLESL